LKFAHADVARTAQETSDASRRVVVIDVQVLKKRAVGVSAIGLLALLPRYSTDRTRTTLHREEIVKPLERRTVRSRDI
jgi:hypothetical protein